MLSSANFEGCGIPAAKLDNFVVPLLHSSGIRTAADLEQFCQSKKQQSGVLDNGLPLAFMEAIVLHCSSQGSSPSHPTQTIFEEIGALLNFSSASSDTGTVSRGRQKRRVVSVVFLAFILYFLLLTLSFLKTEQIETLQYMEEAAGGAGCEKTEKEPVDAPPHIKFVQTLPNRDNRSDADPKEVVKQLDPVSPNGVICVRGSWGRLNNNLIEVKNAFWFAYQLNRTVVVMNRVSGIYDIEKLQNVRPHASYRIALSYSSSLCKKGTYFKEGGHYKKNDDVLPKRSLSK